MKPVIICGGIGSKMWPASRQKSPKHFLKLIGEKSLFQLNYEILRKKFEPGEIFLQTNADQAKIAMEQEPEIVMENVFIEPEMRDQGPATGFAAAMLMKRGLADEPFMLIQADVLREPAEYFLKLIDIFDESIKREGKLMTGGMKPSFAVMGVDYLVVDPETHRMSKWLGRGTKEEVEGYLSTGEALIHTNHYAWTARKLLECFQKLRPEWYQPLMNIVAGDDVAEEYGRMPKGRIEEVTHTELANGFVYELPFRWIDFGTWESVSKYLGQNPSTGSENGVQIDSKDNLIRMPQGKMIATIGVENLVIVDTGDALLVMKKDQSGRVGEVVDKLKEEGKTELL